MIFRSGLNISIELPHSIYHRVTRDLFKLDCDDRAAFNSNSLDCDDRAAFNSNSLDCDGRAAFNSNSLDCDDQTPLGSFDTIVRDLLWLVKQVVLSISLIYRSLLRPDLLRLSLIYRGGV